jgi:hypothetical protein
MMTQPPWTKRFYQRPAFFPSIETDNETEVVYFQEYNKAQSADSRRTFRRNISPLYSESKNKPSKKSEWRM